MIDLGIGRKREALGEIKGVAELDVGSRWVLGWRRDGAIRRCCTYPSACADLYIVV